MTSKQCITCKYNNVCKDQDRVINLLYALFYCNKACIDYIFNCK